MPETRQAGFRLGDGVTSKDLMRNTPNKPLAFGLITLICHNEKRVEGISNADIHVSDGSIRPLTDPGPLTAAAVILIGLRRDRRQLSYAAGVAWPRRAG